MAGHVYLIGSNIFHWYKIGKSNDATLRVSELGILLPFRVEIIAIWKVHNHHQAEKLLHQKYEKYRINGEWFQFTLSELEKLVQGMKAVEVESAKGYTNIEKDTVSMRRVVTKSASDENIDAFIKRVEEDPLIRNASGGVEFRLKQLIKKNHELKRTIQNLLDNQKLPTV